MSNCCTCLGTGYQEATWECSHCGGTGDCDCEPCDWELCRQCDGGKLEDGRTCPICDGSGIMSLEGDDDK